MTHVEEQEVARFYTRSRRFPKVIGRFHDGTRIPGGPYTIPQVVLGGLVLAGAMMTRSYWGTGSILFDVPVALGIGWGAAWAAGRIPATRRNLLSVLYGAIHAAMSPAAGKYRERPFRLRAPHLAGGGTTIAASPVITDVDALRPAPNPPAEVATTPAPLKPTVIPAKAVTGVERLLQQTRK